MTQPYKLNITDAVAEKLVRESGKQIELNPGYKLSQTRPNNLTVSYQKEIKKCRNFLMSPRIYQFVVVVLFSTKQQGLLRIELIDYVRLIDAGLCYF